MCAFHVEAIIGIYLCSAVTGKTDRELARIASLRQSVRPRPDDITSLLLEIQRGMKLNHVPCDDRSKPLVRRCQTFYPEF